MIFGMDLRFSLASSEALANLFLKTLTRTSAAITAATPLLFCCITVLTASSFDCAGAMVKEVVGAFQLKEKRGENGRAGELT